LLWLVFAAGAIWLWASLAPQITYPTASSGEPNGDVLIAWPGWAVQQELGELRGTIGRFDIWVSTDPDGGELTLLASLVDASTKDVLRQTRVLITPAYTPVARTLTFPSYAVPEGQRLLLQLEAAPWEGRYVVYGLTLAQSTYANLALNGVADAGAGPLAFGHYVTTSGLRAALRNQTDARNTLALALVLSGLTALAYPGVAAQVGLRGAADAATRLAQRTARVTQRLDGPSDHASADQQVRGRLGALSAPWHPWPVALIPILHFLASNPLHFTVHQALVPAAGVLLAVTAGVVGLWLVIRDWRQAAAVMTAVTIVVFAYGHVDLALDGRFDDRVLFPSAAVLAVAAVWLVLHCRNQASRLTPFLNVTAGVLILFQVVSLADMTAGISVQAPQLFSPTDSDVNSNRPDIYYIILDAYGRHDRLGEFDNSPFLNALETRGFYVAKEATSNYRGTIQSLASSLNLDYLHNLPPTTGKTRSDGIELTQNSTLAATLQSLGYTYVHLESGTVVSDRAPTADISVSFTPAGVVVSGAVEEVRHSPNLRATQSEGVRHNSFLRSLIETTALRPLTGHRFRSRDDSPYDWWSPERVLHMFEFLAQAPHAPGPTFVFAHILKPHTPATFDRHGNMLISHRKRDQFSDDHDPAVPDAYIGQLVFTNTLVLRTIDRILESRSEKPIIVIASDHAHYEPDKHAVLAAFHFPDGGNSVLYPSISSVNHFRSMLDYYFGFNLSLLDDIKFDHHANQFDIPLP
jgi:hypothetical protein